MKYKIETKESGLNIEVSDAKEKQQELLEAFQECKEGRCSCPTNEYTKLDALEIENSDGAINLNLKAKPDQQFDEAEISKCLEYMKQKVADKD